MSLFDVFAAIFWFMFLLTWVLMLISIFRDIFGDHQLSGGAKALWSLFLIVAPWLGALIYLVARGGSMHERAVAQAQRNQRASGDDVRETAGVGPASAADEIGKLADLRDRGVLSAYEFDLAKAKVLGTAPAPTAATDGLTVPRAT